MYEREWLFRVENIVNAIEKIQRILSQTSHDEFINDDDKWNIVAFQLIVIGEAAKLIPEEIRNRYSELPWRDMIDVRNRMAHDYLNVNLNIVWKLAMEDLPPLIEPLKRIYKDFDNLQSN